MYFDVSNLRGLSKKVTRLVFLKNVGIYRREISRS